MACKLVNVLSQPAQLFGEREYRISASVGIALFPRDGTDADVLIRNADTAMYHAKESGRANYQFFSAQMTERVSRRLSTETELRRALERGEFVAALPAAGRNLGTGRASTECRGRCCAGRRRIKRAMSRRPSSSPWRKRPA